MDPFSRRQERATFAVATQPELRAQASPLVPHGAGERLAHEAEAYLAAVEFLRDKGFEPTWRSDDATIWSSRCLHASDGLGKVSVPDEGIQS